MKKKSSRKKIILPIIILTTLILCVVAFFVLKNLVFKPFQIEETQYLYIEEDDTVEKIILKLNDNGLPSEKIFRMLAQRMNYNDNQIKTGKYEIKPNTTMIHLIRILRTGQQTPLNITFNNIRTKENLVGRLSNQLMIDSISLLNALNNKETIEKLGFDSTTIVAMFIPNTYEVYWDISVDGLMQRMKKEYDRFWNETRLAQAKALELTPIEVSTLASIVEEEATYADEYPIVAGLYLNRLKKGMRLEADPTVKFAVGDFTLRRILYRHLEAESPYNTYKVEGLPPGPIRMPSIKAIDATLQPQSHNYLFMCAKDDLSGRHNFAKTHAEHSRNAARYQRALNKMGIYR